MIEVIFLIFFFTISLFFGDSFLILFGFKKPKLLRLSAGLLLGASFISLVIFYATYLFPFSRLLILAFLAIFLGLAFIIRSRSQILFSLKNINFNRENWLTLFFLSFWTILFISLWSKILVIEKDGWFSSCTNCWGDWSAHLTYTTSFAFANNFPPQLPIYVGESFHYPFLNDFLSAILVNLGTNLPSALLLPGFVFSLCLVVILSSLGRQLTGKISVGMLTVYLFLFNGGLGFWWFFKDIEKQGFWQILTNLPKEYTHLGDFNIQWINVITSQLIPQRGFLLGFPLSVIGYYLFWRFWQERQVNFLRLSALLAILLPLIQVHSFIAVNLVAGFLFIFAVIYRKDKVLVIKNWANYFLPVLFLGATQTLYFYGSLLGKSDFSHWHLGWMVKGFWPQWPAFWLLNLGLILPLSLIGFLLAPKKIKAFAIPFWLLFILANFWQFQPWDWDNTKIFLHWYLLVAIFAAVTIDFILRSRWWLIKLLGLIVFVLSIFSGSLDVARLFEYSAHKFQFWSKQQLSLAEWIKSQTKSRAVYLTSDNHSHWLPALTGRQIVMGYQGWLWTYGINYQERENDIKKIFSGGSEAGNLLKKYQINYVVIGPDERQEKKWSLNENFFEKNFSLVLSEKDYKIFQTSAPSF
ncbi:hypothetical protein A2160_05425 [Candidatus Beckwithbacteria bacterium RBG_13_42_9]|uniref:Glycosyltransferase RgtA/B/C/D-like domain-containing protein n=1 Tax=Candidatus Beckwithbacteria bacterium RBG_13_42_9 TaxID=1797457 RepID=A0A1F5E720_9BACT|nr:MAG: hypothetical protein A2160_05425 [Candidatus Beckwithbacteria bacterium RBG_13_42_9]